MIKFVRPQTQGLIIEWGTTAYRGWGLIKYVRPNTRGLDRRGIYRLGLLMSCLTFGVLLKRGTKQKLGATERKYGYHLVALIYDGVKMAMQCTIPSTEQFTFHTLFSFWQISVDFAIECKTCEGKNNLLPIPFVLLFKAKILSFV